MLIQSSSILFFFFLTDSGLYLYGSLWNDSTSQLSPVASPIQVISASQTAGRGWDWSVKGRQKPSQLTWLTFLDSEMFLVKGPMGHWARELLSGLYGSPKLGNGVFKVDPGHLLLPSLGYQVFSANWACGTFCPRPRQTRSVTSVLNNNYDDMLSTKRYKCGSGKFSFPAMQTMWNRT